MSYSQFCRIKSLYLDLHGLIFETSIWLLAGSTRLKWYDQHNNQIDVLDQSELYVVYMVL